MMRARRTIMMAMAAAGLSFGLPVAASAQNGTVITIFGNDKCPTSNGQQTNICVRAPESERYRIPKDLRTGNEAPPAATKRVEAMNSTANSGIGSCTVGNGSFTGCQLEEIRKAKAERRAAKRAAPAIE
jgi:hypothetical protein